MRNTIHLHGAMKKRFGGPFTLDVRTPAEALRALCCMVKGFDQALRAGAWRVVRGPLRGKGSRSLTRDELGVNLPGEMHLVAAAAGAKQGGGATKIILGVMLIAAAFIFAPAAVAGATGMGAGGMAGAAFGASFTAYLGITGTQVALFGLAMAFAGVSALLAPTPKGNNNAKDTKASYGFSGLVNLEDQGTPVPIGCGKMRIPGLPISVGVDVVDLPT